MLTLKVEFLNGTYHAADPINPTRPEWPPSPDRVFQALVDAAAALALPLAPLRALERPPEIAFGGAVAVYGTTVYVPAAFTEGKTAAPHSRSPVAKADPIMVDITDPVCYAWDVPAELRDWLQKVAGAVTHLGRAKSPVIASVVDSLPALAHRRVPALRGEELLRAPMPGRLDVLESAHRARARPPVAMLTGYADPSESVIASPWDELLVLRTTDEVLLREAAQFTEAARAAVLALAGDTAPLALHGHAAIPHVAWCLLPDVGHRHAQGRVLGLGVWLPAAILDADRTACVLPLARLERVVFGRRHIGVRRVPESGLPGGLTATAWTRASRTWATVTPLVLDRNPKGGQSIETSVADSVEMAGYPRPTVVEVCQHSAHPGAPLAHHFRPRRPGRWTHARVSFDTLVQGPVIVGRERYFGLGLMRALPHQGACQHQAA